MSKRVSDREREIEVHREGVCERKKEREREREKERESGRKKESEKEHEIIFDIKI